MIRKLKIEFKMITILAIILLYLKLLIEEKLKNQKKIKQKLRKTFLYLDLSHSLHLSCTKITKNYSKKLKYDPFKADIYSIGNTKLFKYYVRNISANDGWKIIFIYLNIANKIDIFFC